MFCESALVPVRLDAATGRVPLLVRFSYNGRDPYAVQAAFFDGPYLLARWRFDRQMLAEGLQRPVGEGDVAFRPHTRAGVGELRMDLRGQGGEREEKAVLFVDADALTVFLQQTYAVVGAGAEFLDLDKLLDEFLAR
ncbi:SsgA family sporulation/cell division regulator [Streptomyces sp. NBC_01244]|uniref:SsgA family sporulation/cell division regulator n=1 Tax=Streptomyces sp. NBC_01244 TaxID=2903797 RepID=UPI002E103286|nr:SsgA family sporulation/cell division regulator [Streptomyces sp. NBC_01244]